MGEVWTLLPFADDSAGYLFSGVTGRLRTEVIGIAMDHLITDYAASCVLQQERF